MNMPPGLDAFSCSVLAPSMAAGPNKAARPALKLASGEVITTISVLATEYDRDVSEVACQPRNSSAASHIISRP
jgi:hypothetical protein